MQFHTKENNLEEKFHSSEREILLKVETEIKKEHSHSDGSPVVLSAVEKSEIESMLSDSERMPEKSSEGGDNQKYKNMEPEQPASGLYASESKVRLGPIFVCTCGVHFSASAGQGGVEVYKVDDYSTSGGEGGYGAKPEPIMDSYRKKSSY